MKLTKHREGEVWQVHADGRRTGLFIAKGDAPRFREPQTYWLMNDGETLALEGKSVSGLMRDIETIAAALAVAD